MSILIKHIYNNIRENKFRSVVIVLIVLLCTSVSFVVLNLQDIIVYNYDKVYNASVGEANITIQSRDGTTYSADTLNFEGIKIEKQSDIYQLYGRYVFGQSVVKANLIGVRLDEYQGMDAVAILNSTSAFSLHNGECIISLKTSEKYGLTIGNPVAVNIGEQEYVFTIAAIAEPNRTFYEEKGNIQILISLEDANTLNQTLGLATKTRLKVDAADMTEAANLLINQNDGFAVIQGEEFEQLHYNLTTVSSVMLIIVIIIIIIAFYILFSLVKLIMMDRLPVIGTFRSVGANRGKVVRILLLEFLSYGMIGTTLGLLVGIPLLPFVSELFNQYKEFGVATEVKYNIGYGVIAVGIGLLLPIISALFQVIKTSKIPLKDIILKPSSKLSETSMKSVLFAGFFLLLSLVLYFINTADNSLVGFIGLFCLICGSAFLVPIVMTCLSKLLGLFILTGSGTIGLSNLKSNKTVRNISSMFVVVILIVLMMGTLTNGIKNVAATDIANSSAYDVIITLNGEELRADDLQNMKNIDAALNSYETMWYGNYCTGTSRVYGIGQFEELTKYVKSLQYDGPNLDYLIQQTPNGIIIDEYWARVQNLSIGDSLSMYADEKHTTKIGVFTVVAFWDSSTGTTDRGFVGIKLDDYNALITNIPDKILIKTQSPKEVAQAISEMYLDTDIAVVTTVDFLAEQISAVESMIGTMLACVVLGAVIIVCGIVSNLIVTFMQRKKEYAVMYSVCMSKSQLVKMIFLEFLFSYIAIGLVSLVSGYMLSEFFLAKAANGTGMTINFSFNALIMIGILAVIFFIYAITTLLPVQRLKKMNVIKELKYE